ncbi:hypothetical protein RESH_05073 [Rhodopirellula europaea SH398]|uniref:Uncharacterized protein n=1 Tax=Rhodopirellula europaea SH398 TaxID=1263868 RepID=M5S9M5_9BACT|nr:hypothetical protein RESH_05073 [Rhodopirellula europaea SH398]
MQIVLRKYSSSPDAPPLHFRHAGTVSRSLGRGVSKSAFGGMWSRVTSPTYPQIAHVPRRFEFRFAITVKDAFVMMQVHSQNASRNRVASKKFAIAEKLDTRLRFTAWLSAVRRESFSDVFLIQVKVAHLRQDCVQLDMNNDLINPHVLYRNLCRRPWVPVRHAVRQRISILHHGEFARPQSGKCVDIRNCSCGPITWDGRKSVGLTNVNLTRKLKADSVVSSTIESSCVKRTFLQVKTSAKPPDHVVIVEGTIVCTIGYADRIIVPSVVICSANGGTARQRFPSGHRDGRNGNQDDQREKTEFGTHRLQSDNGRDHRGRAERQPLPKRVFESSACIPWFVGSWFHREGITTGEP